VTGEEFAIKMMMPYNILTSDEANKVFKEA
jgi:hypothetical protein